MKNESKKSGPVIGVPKGSQKRAKHPTATDDPDKYIGKWEAYTEPQGIEHKKVSEGLEQFSETGITINPNSDEMANLLQMASQSSRSSAHVKGLYDPRGRFIAWDGIGDSVHHAMVLDELVEQFGQPSFEQWYDFVEEDVTSENIPKDLVQDYYYESDGYIPIIIAVDKHGGIDNTWAAFEKVFDTQLVRNSLPMTESLRDTLESIYSDKTKYNTEWVPSLMPDPKDAPKVAPYHSPPPGKDGIKFIIDFGVKNSMQDKAHKKDNRKRTKPQVKETGASDIQGGPGVSNDLVPRDRTVLTIADLEDTHPNDVDIKNNKAPQKQAERKNKKLNTDTHGLVHESTMNEMRRRMPISQLNAEYELRNDSDTDTLGTANIINGVIQKLSIRNDYPEDYTGHILSRLLSTIVNDADMSNANLSIRLEDPSDLQHKRFLERFGFRHIKDGVMKRTAGAIRPPSVVSSRI